MTLPSFIDFWLEAHFVMPQLGQHFRVGAIDPSVHNVNGYWLA